MISKEVKQVIQDSPLFLSLPFQQSFIEFENISTEKIQIEPVFIIPEAKPIELQSWQEGYVEPNFQLLLEGFRSRDIPYKRPKILPSQPVVLFRKNEGIQPELVDWQLLKDVMETTANFELSISSWSRKRSVNEKWKIYEKLRKKDEKIPKDWESMDVAGVRVDHPLIGILLNRSMSFYNIVTRDSQIGPLIEQINIRHQPVRKEVKILAEEKIWHQLMWSEWESEKGVIEYNAKIQGWEILVFSDDDDSIS